MLGAPLGHPEFIRGFGQKHVDKTSRLLDAMKHLPQSQHYWLLLYFCLVPRFNHLLRQVPPSLIQHTAHAFDNLTLSALGHLLDLPDWAEWSPALTTQAQLPARFGGIGLRSSTMLSPAAFCASWADVMPALGQRYPPGYCMKFYGHWRRRRPTRHVSQSLLHHIPTSSA